MSKFEKWFTAYRPSLDTSSIEAEFIYEAGAQSKQAEIDELRKQLDLINQYTAAQGESIKIINDERLELQKRIDDAIERSNHAHIGYQMLYKQFDDVIKILKGKTNEQ